MLFSVQPAGKKCGTPGKKNGIRPDDGAQLSKTAKERKRRETFRSDLGGISTRMGILSCILGSWVAERACSSIPFLNRDEVTQAFARKECPICLTSPMCVPAALPACSDCHAAAHPIMCCYMCAAQHLQLDRRHDKREPAKHIVCQKRFGAHAKPAISRAAIKLLDTGSVKPPPCPVCSTQEKSFRALKDHLLTKHVPKPKPSCFPKLSLSLPGPTTASSDIQFRVGYGDVRRPGTAAPRPSLRCSFGCSYATDDWDDLSDHYEHHCPIVNPAAA